MEAWYVPIWQEDRSKLDSRRVAALVIDGLVLAPLLLPLSIAFGSITREVWLLYVACELSYFHILETHTGQTLGKRAMGLRVVRASDAGPASAKAISVRTALRLIDGLPFLYIVGLVTMLATRKRRQRLGDLAARTVVTRASSRPYTPARRSPLVTIYPSLWIGAAAALLILIGRAGDAYLASVDKLCAEAESQARALQHPTLDAQLPIFYELERRIALLRPANARTVRARQEILQLLDSKLRIAAQLADRFRNGGSQVEFRAEMDAFLALQDSYSRRLYADYGLGHC